MAFYRGQDGSVFAGPTPTQVGQVTEWGANVQQAILDGTTMGDDWEVSVGGLGSWTAQLTVKFDQGNAGQALFTAKLFAATPDGTALALQLRAGSDALKMISGNVIITSAEITHRTNDLLVAVFGVKGSGPPTLVWS